MPSPELTARAEAALERPPLSEIGVAQAEELRLALAQAEAFEDLPGKWQAAILEAESRRRPRC